VRTTPLTREALLSAAAAAVVAAMLVWLGPPGTDFAAHVYQRAVFLHHGFALWNNFWYAGRYSFVTYSLLYYPLAALLGIKLLAVATVATAALAFAVVIGREWGPIARWSSRTFAVMWAGIAFSAAFPFALGAALALMALWALQAGARGRFALLAVLTLAASPLAFLMLVIVLAGIGLARRMRPGDLVVPAVTIAVAAAFEIVLWRLFPEGGRYPFSVWSLLGVGTFCVIGAAVTWRVERARVLRWVFLAYLAACLVSFAVPSEIGSNILRLREAAVPVIVLALSLRRWRPLPLCVGVLALAVAWNVTPHVVDVIRNNSDPASRAAYWRPAIRYLHRHLTPSYRVEAVDTAGHWPAVYLARAGIPLVRGWFRQADYPANAILYDEFGRSTYLRWLRGLGVRYVVLTRAPPDYTAREEAALLEGGRAGLRPVLTTPNVSVYVVPHAARLVTGPGEPRVALLTRDGVRLTFTEPGTYRLAVRYSPYWSVPSGSCLTKRADGMIRLAVRRAGPVDLRFHVDGSRALAAFVGSEPQACS
jgi:hypothetical protein